MEPDKTPSRNQPKSDDQGLPTDRGTFERAIEKIKRHPLILGIALVSSLITWVAQQTEALSTIADVIGFPTKQRKAHDLAVEILSHTFRRATSVNFALRGMDGVELLRVQASIGAAHAAVQSKMVDFKSVGDPVAVGILESMLTSLNNLEKQFIEMGKLLRTADLQKQAGLLMSTSLEGAVLQQQLNIAEQLRQEYLFRRYAFAEKTNVVLPLDPDD